MMEREILATVYLLVLSGLALYGFLAFFTLWLYRRHHDEPTPHPRANGHELPPVTVQLPLYNERYVVERLLRAAVDLRYPSERLQIQVLDDSSDETTAEAAALVAKYRRQGINIELRHRDHRAGFKAGALAEATVAATGQFVAVFDADFAPPSDFLVRTIPHFLDAPDLGMVQARWGHLNATQSPITVAQAIALDKHFAVEQLVRYRADLFPKFNGTAGVWRRTCIDDAGGWQSDTLCEDLCLSTRAIIKGWRFRLLPDLVAPAELPSNLAAYKNQQSRWATGSTQCLMKFGHAILSSAEQRLAARVYALLSMGAYATSLFLIALLLLQVPLLWLDYHFSPWLVVFGIAGFGQPLLFALGQRALHRDWASRLRYFPVLFLLAIGLSAVIGRAVLRGVLGRHQVFTRTPKRGSGGEGYRLPFDRIVLVELSLALYAAIGVAFALWRANFGPLFFLSSCLLGFGLVALASARESFR